VEESHVFEFRRQSLHVGHAWVQNKLGGEVVQVGVSGINGSLSVFSEVDWVNVFLSSLQKSVGSFDLVSGSDED